MPSVDVPKSVDAEEIVPILVAHAADGAKVVRRYRSDRHLAVVDEVLFPGKRPLTKARRSRLENRLRRLARGGTRLGVLEYDEDRRRWGSVAEFSVSDPTNLVFSW